jgi:hypothetical protein
VWGCVWAGVWRVRFGGGRDERRWMRVGGLPSLRLNFLERLKGKGNKEITDVNVIIDVKVCLDMKRCLRRSGRLRCVIVTRGEGNGDILWRFALENER